mmetsp:Transcript_23331/g.53205  ORF Transcript_23331/g.53205 Transcript_23331/m.53205 type:complete len:335 (-) Transcript_23331:256-1260(-)
MTRLEVHATVPAASAEGLFRNAVLHGESVLPSTRALDLALAFGSLFEAQQELSRAAVVGNRLLPDAGVTQDELLAAVSAAEERLRRCDREAQSTDREPHLEDLDDMLSATISSLLDEHYSGCPSWAARKRERRNIPRPSGVILDLDRHDALLRPLTRGQQTLIEEASRLEALCSNCTQAQSCLRSVWRQPPDPGAVGKKAQALRKAYDKPLFHTTGTKALFLPLEVDLPIGQAQIRQSIDELAAKQDEFKARIKLKYDEIEASGIQLDGIGRDFDKMPRLTSARKEAKLRERERRKLHNAAWISSHGKQPSACDLEWNCDLHRKWCCEALLQCV